MRKRWKKGSEIMEAEPDDPIFSRKFVIGGRVRRASPASSSKRGLKLKPAPPDHRIYSSGFVLGGKVHRASPASSSKPAKSRGRRLPHQYPWIDSLDDILLPESPPDDSDE
jgi:hypothetical protein